MSHQRTFLIPVVIAAMLSSSVAFSHSALAAASDWFVVSGTSGNCDNVGTQVDPFHSVQCAIDAASSNDTVHVAGGEYAGFTVSKSLSILGPNAGVAPGPASSRQAEAVITSPVSIASAVDGATISGFRLSSVNSEDVGLSVGSNSRNVEITYNEITGFDQGIRSAGNAANFGSDMDVSHNYIHGLSVSASGSYSIHLRNVKNLTVSDNIVTDSVTSPVLTGSQLRRGILLRGAQNAVVSNNIVDFGSIASSKSYYAISIAQLLNDGVNGSDLPISDLDITGNTLSGSVNGVNFLDLGAQATNVLIEGNTARNVFVGVSFKSYGQIGTPAVHELLVQNNDFSRIEDGDGVLRAGVQVYSIDTSAPAAGEFDGVVIRKNSLPSDKINQTSEINGLSVGAINPFAAGFPATLTFYSHDITDVDARGNYWGTTVSPITDITRQANVAGSIVSFTDDPSKAGQPGFWPTMIDAAATTVCADGCDYTSIQTAVNAATAGDTITVGAGTYAGFTVDKLLSILGPNDGVAPGPGTSRQAEAVITSAVRVMSATDGVTISGFKLGPGSAGGVALSVESNSRNVSVTYNDISGFDQGIRSEGNSLNFGSGMVVSHNYVHTLTLGSTGSYAVHLRNVKELTVTENIITDTLTDPGLTGVKVRRGIVVRGTENAEIRDNVVDFGDAASTKATYGINIAQLLNDGVNGNDLAVSNLEIVGNSLSGAMTGINFLNLDAQASNVVISRNTARNVFSGVVFRSYGQNGFTVVQELIVKQNDFSEIDSGAGVGALSAGLQIFSIDVNAPVASEFDGVVVRGNRLPTDQINNLAGINGLTVGAINPLAPGFPSVVTLHATDITDLDARANYWGGSVPTTGITSQANVAGPILSFTASQDNNGDAGFWPSCSTIQTATGGGLDIQEVMECPPGTLGTPTATAGNARATVSWTAPTSGATPFTYAVNSTPSGAICVVTGVTAVCNELTNGTSYSFAVTATNTFGSTVSSASNSVRPVPPTPNAVDDTSTGPFGATQTKDVLDNDTSNTGAGLDGALLRLIDPNTGNAVTSVTTVDGTFTANGDGTITFAPTAGFDGEANSVTYRVTDSLGQTATATYTPTVTNPPGVPGTPTATAGDARATVSWTAPTSGATPFSYTVNSDPAGATCVVTGVTAVCNELTNGTSYSFVVTATNSFGSTVSSASNTVRPVEATTPTTPTTPTEPTNPTTPETTGPALEPGVIDGLNEALTSAPIPSAVIAVPEGGIGALVGGVPVEVRIVSMEELLSPSSPLLSNSGAITLSADSTSLTIANPSGGSPLVVDVETLVVIEVAGVFLALGNASGGQPGAGGGTSGVLPAASGDTLASIISGLPAGGASRAFLFSEPIDAGTVVADDDGNAIAVVDLPSDFAAGLHHLQLNTSTADGDPVSIAIALEVSESETGAETGTETESEGAGDWSTWLMLGVTLIAVLVASIVIVRRVRARKD